jgi:hypothetical protein
MINQTEPFNLEKEIKDYTDRLNSMRADLLRIEGVILYLQNLLQQNNKN